MHLDPDVLRSKPRSQIERWLKFSRADAAYEDWLMASAKVGS